MFLRPALLACLQSKLYSSLNNTKSLRPSIKISKEKFQLCVDVHHYNKDEIRVKAHQQYVTIEGKQEKYTQQGYVLRQFIRKFKLPDGCVPSKIKCTLGPQGMLTVEVERSFKDANTPADMVVVPISYGPGIIDKKDTMIGPPPDEPQVCVNPCDNCSKVRPKPESKPEK